MSKANIYTEYINLAAKYSALSDERDKLRAALEEIRGLAANQQAGYTKGVMREIVEKANEALK